MQVAIEQQPAHRLVDRGAADPTTRKRLRRRRRIILTTIFAFLVLFDLASAQDVSFDLIPRDFQLFPRSSGNVAPVIFSGTVMSPGHDRVRLDVCRDGQSFASDSASLVYLGNAAPFRLEVLITAELSEYAARFYVDDNLIVVRDSLVCGDVFLINGQSNAVSGDAEGLATATSQWFRSFGTSSTDPESCRTDTTWSRAQGHRWNTHAAVGVWGLTVGLTLSDRYQVPVAVLNGAVDATQIVSHLRDDEDPMNLTSIYGRLLWRSMKAGVKDHIRAVLWYQGESDTYNDPWDSYDDRFDRLSNEWHEDYPSLEKVFVFQLHPGCGGGFQSQMRELQRTLPDRHPNVEVMTTVGLEGYYGCHFDYGGYSQMGRRLLGILTRDLYGSDDTLNVTPPDVQLAWYDSDRDEVFLRYDSEVRWPADTLGARMRDYFYVNGHGENGRIASGRVLEDGRTVLLTLVSPLLLADRVTYLPNCCYPNGSSYRGPWIRNVRGLAAYSFWDFPIQEHSQVASSAAPTPSVRVRCVPSPSEGATRICFGPGSSGPVRLEINDVEGRSVRTLLGRSTGAGDQVILWDGRDDAGRCLPAGVYVCAIESRWGVSRTRFALIR